MDCPRVHDTSNNRTSVWYRESVVDQEFGRLVDDVLPMERKDVKKCSHQFDTFSGDIWYPEDRADI